MVTSPSIQVPIANAQEGSPDPHNSRLLTIFRSAQMRNRQLHGLPTDDGPTIKIDKPLITDENK